MISINIHKEPNGRYICSTDNGYLALDKWLESELGRTGYAYDSGSLVEDLFAQIGAFRAGKKEYAQVWADLARVTVNSNGAKIELTQLKSQCEMSMDDLVEAVLSWFDVVNPDLATRLKKIKATWQR